MTDTDPPIAAGPAPEPLAEAAPAGPAEPARPEAARARTRTVRALWLAWAVLLVLTLIAGGLALLALYPERAAQWGLRPPPADAGLAGRVSALSAKMDALGNRLDTLSGRVDSVERKAAAPAPTPAPAPQAELDALTARDQALEQRLGGIEGTVRTLQNIEQHDQDLTERVGRVEARLEQVAADQKSAAEADQRAALALAIGALEAAAHGGAPFSAQLAAVRRLGVPADAMPVLTARAAAGIPTQAELAARFPALADAALRAERLAGADGWFGRAWARLRNLVVARPVGEAAGADSAAVLARAQARLDAGKLNDAVKEVRGLTGAAAQTLAPWIADARARLSADAELAALQDRVLNDMAGRG